MTIERHSTDSSRPLRCQIRLRGHLGGEWAGWFGNLIITLEDNGETLLAGLVTDQAALYGLLRKVRDVGMPLRSVLCEYPGQEETPLRL